MEIVHRDDVGPEQRAHWDRICQETTQVTGMLSRWDSGISAIFAVRIEVLRDFLTRHVPKA